MKFLRAIGFGAFLWVLIFFEVSVLMFGFGLSTPTINYINYAIMIILAGLASYLYFRGRNVSKGSGQGFILGLIMALTGIVLDAIITVPLFVKSYSFFADVYLWIGIFESVIITTIVGALKK